jgi:predicted DNA-binding mobile mystery protein A
LLRNVGARTQQFRENVVLEADENTKKSLNKAKFKAILQPLLHIIWAILARVKSGTQDTQGAGTMRERDRKLMRMRLDAEMRIFRLAGKKKSPTKELLRAARQALGIPVAEIAEKMGVDRSSVFELETRERKNTIALQSMSRLAEAMGCQLVYGIVPKGGKTLERLAEERLWAAVLGKTN